MKTQKIEKNRFRRTLAFALAVCLAVGLTGGVGAIPAKAVEESSSGHGEVVQSGYCNFPDGPREGGIDLSDEITEPTTFFTFYEDRTLVAYGDGPIFGFWPDSTNQELFNSMCIQYINGVMSFADLVLNIIIEEGITGIGGTALTGPFTNITELVIP
ncbi:MAG: hypothetical protein LBK23_00760, partial [Oscillospiraceae bacterium]|nr:hypothetical protein [Oscillospiraceae bacterium]